MNYRIPLNKLEKLANPFRDNLFEFPIEEKDIQLAIFNAAIFESESDEPKQKLIKQIAYKVTNYYPQEISINLTSDNIENAGNIIQEGLTDLAAAIYLKEKNVVGRIEGDEKVISTLLAVDLNKPDNIEVQKITSPKIFSWEAIKEEVNDSWSDPAFVVSQIKNNYDRFNPKGSYNLVCPLIKNELWENIEFYKELNKVDDNFINYIPKEGKYSLALVEYILENPRQLFQLWDAGYGNIYKNFKAKGQIGSRNMPDDQFAAPEEFKNNIKLNIQKIQHAVFENKEVALNLTHDDVRCDFFYNCFSESLKYDFDILDRLLHIKKTKERYYHPRVHVLQNFPEHYSDDFQWVKTFLSRYSELFNLEYLSPTLYKSCEYDKLLDKHINDQNKVKEIINAVKSNKEAYNLYKILPNNIKNDESVITEFIKFYPVVFEYLSKEQKLKILPQVINNANFKSSDLKIESSVITKISDKDVLVQLVEMEKFDWFFQKQSAKWHDDKDLLIAIAKKTDYVLTHPEFREKILSFDNEVYKEILSSNEKFFNMLPSEKRNDPELVLVYLQNFKKVNEIPEQFFLSKQFCLKALTITESAISKIPEPFWQHQDFALEFCKLLDSYQVSKKTILNAPKYVAQLFDDMGVKDNYTEFMNSYFLNLKLKANLPTKDNQKNKKKI